MDDLAPGPWTILTCPVRGCGAPLAPSARGLVCPRGHAFDRARSGYVNLLQPNDRRSLAAGDRPEATRARADLAAAGVGSELRSALARRVAETIGASARRPARVLEVGAGGGELLGPLAAELAGSAWCVGLDLSATAMDLAARLHPAVAWVVGNADRRLPVADGALDVLVSVTGPKHAPEFARAVRPAGRLVLGVPAPEDLAELRAAVEGEARVHERAERAALHFAAGFEELARERVVERRRLGPAALAALLVASYRGARRSQATRVDALVETEVTLALDVLVLARRAD